jgi:hypothetical protein
LKSLACCLAALILAGMLTHADAPTAAQSVSGYLATHGYFAAKVKCADPSQLNAQSVEAYVNGHEVTLLVDTGSPNTYLTYERARSLGLNIQQLQKEEWGVGGVISGKVGIAAIQNFKLRFGDINHTSALLVLSKNAVLSDGLDGILGADYLALNAAIFPVGGTGILFRPGPVANVPLAGYMAKSHFTGVPMSSGHGHIWVTGYLYGKPLDLVIDSGAMYSNLRASAVRNVMGPNALDSSQSFFTQGLDGLRETSFYFTPARFLLGSLDVSHQTVLASDSAGFDKDKYDGLAGFDLLAKHQAIIDFNNGMLWMH